MLFHLYFCKCRSNLLLQKIQLHFQIILCILILALCPLTVQVDPSYHVTWSRAAGKSSQFISLQPVPAVICCLNKVLTNDHFLPKRRAIVLNLNLCLKANHFLSHYILNGQLILPIGASLNATDWYSFPRQRTFAYLNTVYWLKSVLWFFACFW